MAVESAELRQLFGARPPIASIYLTDPDDARGRLASTWEGIRDTMRRHGFPDRVQTQVEERVLAPPAIGDASGRGRALIADADGILVDCRLEHSPSTDGVRVSSLPYLIPIATQEGPQRDTATAHDVAEQFVAEDARRSGLACQGLGAVAEALRHSNVATLLVGDVADKPVLASLAHPECVGTGPADLAEVGCADGAVRRADEALPYAAVAAGAGIVRVADRLPLSDGVGALRRHT